MKRIVVLGSVNMDLVLNCANLPLPGQTVLGDDFKTLPGGKGANQAVAAARLGAAVSFIGCVGDDDFGRSTRAVLVAEGIDTSQLRTIPGVATGVAMIMVEASGQNCIALSAGANGALSAAHVDEASATIEGAALLICQLESPLPAVQRAVAIAHAAGVPVLLNPAPAQPLPAALLAQVDVLVPNESEAAVLLGLAAVAALDAAAAGDALRALGPRTVIVTLGSAGVQVSCDGVNRHVAATVVKAIDTTGAGDTFIGAYAAARCAGTDLHSAVAYAQQAAAFSVTRPGTIDAMPHAIDLPPLIAEST
ncbi:ribokinase [soil metagenome]